MGKLYMLIRVETLGIIMRTVSVDRLFDTAKGLQESEVEQII